MPKTYCVLTIRLLKDERVKIDPARSLFLGQQDVSHRMG